MSAPLYANPQQASDRKPTSWEDELADVLEGVFAQGVYELEPLVAALNSTRVRPRDGGDWTTERFTRTMAELGD